MKKIRAIGIVLPQFHTIPENDEWWGKGFTEWTNTKKTTPLYKNHYQPHTPHESIGYYDLSTLAGMQQQINMSLNYGLSGLCYYHYWFNEKTLLEKPTEILLENKNLEIPFMLCWANENWSRIWDGRSKSILMEQKYSIEDDEKHMHYLCKKYFKDERYIKINNAPVFALYRHQLLPDIKKTIALWQSIAKDYGFNGLYLIAVENQFNEPEDPHKIGFNASFQFPPHFKELRDITYKNFVMKIKRPFLSKYKFKSIVQYKTLVKYYKQLTNPEYTFYPGVIPGWDNSARRNDLENSYIIENSTPKLYEKFLQNTCEKFIPYSNEENFVFINAVNEWAEGNHLEPCLKWGYKYLKATKKVLEKYS
jgi:lipopolysaccharide biosynthesis protein